MNTLTASSRRYHRPCSRCCCCCCCCTGRLQTSGLCSDRLGARAFRHPRDTCVFETRPAVPDDAPCFVSFCNRCEQSLQNIAESTSSKSICFVLVGRRLEQTSKYTGSYEECNKAHSSVARGFPLGCQLFGTSVKTSGGRTRRVSPAHGTVTALEMINSWNWVHSVDFLFYTTKTPFLVFACFSIHWS